MLETIAVHIAEHFVSRRLVDSDDCDVFRYGVEIILSTLANIITFLALALLFRRLAEGVAFLAVFIIIRQFAGGYHSQTHIGCYFTFLCVSAVLFLCLLFIPQEYLRLISLIFLLAGLLPILTLAPINSPQRHISQAQKQKFRKLSILSSLILTAVITTFLCCNFWPGLTLALSFSILVIGSSLLIPMIMERRRNT